MCGISGFIHTQFDGRSVEPEILKKMNRRLAHRGPDDEGYFFAPDVGLGHRRLSIVDIATGQQPMISADGRYALVFNGQIYNYVELRDELKKVGVVFKTRSDTEVLLYWLVKWGVEGLNRLSGMFSFAFYDTHTKRLICARDPMGKKPFYYWQEKDFFSFASECKAFLEHPQFVPQMNPSAVAHYFQYEYVPSPLAIYKRVQKLPAAHYLVLDPSGVQVKRYWNTPTPQEKIDLTDSEISEKIIELLTKGIERRLGSEVPLGVFLSGGLDSSSVVALMARLRSGPEIKTFSIGFNEASFDESPYARQVAKIFNTDHHEQILTPQTMIDILPEVTRFLDEPFADYSIIPTYLLSRFTRQKITVALGGDGSDELFAGYPTFYAAKVAEVYRSFPSLFKKRVESLTSLLPVSDNDLSFEFKLRQFLYGASFPKILRNQVWLGALHQAEMKNLFVRDSEMGEWIHKNNPLDLVTQTMKECVAKKHGDQLLYFYQKFYLADDILVKTDRASMATSLEVRAPYLDKELVEFVSRLPYQYKGSGTKTKVILKKALQSVLPPEILFRKKKGFSIPIALWLKQELKDSLYESLNPERLKKEGMFNPLFVQKLMEDHWSGQRNNRKPLFALLMFQKWKENFLHS